MTPDILIECGFALFMLLVYLSLVDREEPLHVRERPDTAEEKCYREIEERP